MKIRSLPPKKQITFFEVQYFVNEGKQGKAKNVLAVTYSTHPNRFRAKNDKCVQHREYFDLTCGREINRKTKKHFGAEISGQIKQRISDLKDKHDITTMFGIRQIRYKLPHKTIAGKWFHKRQLDTNNRVFVHIAGDEFTANFFWEGDEISVVVKPHTGELSTGQSVGVGYYTSASADAELEERLLELKRAGAARADESDALLAPTEEAHIADDDASSYVTPTIPGLMWSKKIECEPRIHPAQSAPTVKTRTKHRSTDIRQTEYDIFQELCRHSIFVDETERPAINLGVRFQLPSDIISVSTSI